MLMSEVFLICLFESLLAIILIENLKFFVNQVLQSDLSFRYSEWWFLILFSGVYIITTFLSGSYSALYLSSLRPVNALKKYHPGTGKGPGFFNMLIVFQFLASIFLLIFVTGVQKQIHYIQNKDMGYIRQNIMVLELPADNPPGNIIKEQLLNISGVYKAGLTNDHFAYGFHNNTVFSSDDTEIPFSFSIADFDYLGVMNIKLIKKFRNIDENSRGFIINKKLYTELLSAFSEEEILNGFDRAIIGVMEDFNSESLHTGISNYAINLWPDRFNRFLMIQYKTDNLKQILDQIKERWEDYFPGYHFKYFFFDDLLNARYRHEYSTGKLAGYFSVIAVLISCMGLMCISGFTIQRRTKEIGIRKVGGAKTSEIIFLLLKDFIKWVLISFIIACPVAYYFMNKWLQNFAYRTNLSWWVFAASGIFALAVALLTVSYQSWRAASRNPVEALRYE
jgi:putative ABC transport system permease protein